MTFCAMSRWQPMASMVMIAPSIASMSSSFGIAMISFDFSATLTCPRTRRWRAANAETSARRLTINRDHPSRHPGHRCDPADEAGLELLGVKRGQDVAQMVMGGRAILERAKAAKQLKLFDPE